MQYKSEGPMRATKQFQSLNGKFCGDFGADKLTDQTISPLKRLTSPSSPSPTLCLPLHWSAVTNK